MPARILYPFGGDSVGGSHLSTIEIIKALDRRFEAVPVLHNANGPLAPLLEKEGIEFEEARIAWPPRAGNIPFSILAAKKFIKTHDIDIVHCDDGPLRYIWLYAAKLAGVKYVHVQRTIPILTLEKRMAYRKADAIICNSKATREALPPMLEGLPVAIAYPPVRPLYGPQDKAKNRAALLKELGLAPDTKLVGFIAQIHPRKRPDLFIEIAAILKARNPAVKFPMAGTFYWDTEPKLRALVKARGLENDIIFTGFRADPQAFISALDVMIAPAENEAFGRTLIEALLAGTPVVASREGGHAEIIKDGETGLLAGKPDPAVCAEKADNILKDPILASKIVAAAEMDAARRFAPAASFAVFNEAYAKLASGAMIAKTREKK